MARYFEPIAVNELRKKIGVFRNPYDLIESLGNDIKVAFDLENFDDCGDFGPKGLMGYQTTPWGLTFCGMCAGGDWEQPVFFIVYWDGKDLRGYVPTEGNPWNTDTKQAYGNNEVYDLPNAQKRYPGKYDDVDSNVDSVDGFDFGFNADAILTDIAERIQKREKKPKKVAQSAQAKLDSELIFRDPRSINYDKAIADAAKVWRVRRLKNDLDRTEETVADLKAAQARLDWMIDAATYGWNPANYTPKQ